MWAQSSENQDDQLDCLQMLQSLLALPPGHGRQISIDNWDTAAEGSGPVAALMKFPSVPGLLKEITKSDCSASLLSRQKGNPPQRPILELAFAKPRKKDDEKVVEIVSLSDDDEDDASAKQGAPQPQPNNDGSGNMKKEIESTVEWKGKGKFKWIAKPNMSMELSNDEKLARIIAHHHAQNLPCCILAGEEEVTDSGSDESEGDAGVSELENPVMNDNEIPGCSNSMVTGNVRMQPAEATVTVSDIPVETSDLQENLTSMTLAIPEIENSAEVDEAVGMMPAIPREMNLQESANSGFEPIMLPAVPWEDLEETTINSFGTSEISTSMPLVIPETPAAKATVIPTDNEDEVATESGDESFTDSSDLEETGKELAMASTSMLISIPNYSMGENATMHENTLGANEDNLNLATNSRDESGTDESTTNAVLEGSTGSTSMEIAIPENSAAGTITGTSLKMEISSGYEADISEDSLKHVAMEGRLGKFSTSVETAIPETLSGLDDVVPHCRIKPESFSDDEDDEVPDPTSSSKMIAAHSQSQGEGFNFQRGQWDDKLNEEELQNIFESMNLSGFYRQLVYKAYFKLDNLPSVKKIRCLVIGHPGAGTVVIRGMCRSKIFSEVQFETMDLEEFGSFVGKENEFRARMRAENIMYFVYVKDCDGAFGNWSNFFEHLNILQSVYFISNANILLWRKSNNPNKNWPNLDALDTIMNATELKFTMFYHDQLHFCSSVCKYLEGRMKTVARIDLETLRRQMGRFDANSSAEEVEIPMKKMKMNHGVTV